MTTLVNIKKVLKKLTIVFVILFILCFPFKYNLFKINFLANLFEGITQKVAPFILHSTNTYTLAFYSDSTGMYINLVNLVFVSFIVIGLWFFFDKKIEKIISFKTLFSIFTIGVCYYLSLQFSIYGFSKLFKYQFYDAHPNTLFTPVGFLTKDFLYWTSVGSSKLYNTVVGFVEVMTAILLLFRKTRSLASVLGCIICVHIVLINFAFDINVKIQSLFLLLLFFIVSYPSFKNMYAIFIQRKTTISYPRINALLYPKWFRILKFVLIAFICAESLYPYIKNQNFNGDTLPKPPYYGAYKIENNPTYKRFFIHSDPYFIIQDHNDELYSFEMDLQNEKMLLKYNTLKSMLSFKVNDSIISLKGDFFGTPLHISARKINISTMPLYEDTFHWTIDQY